MKSCTGLKLEKYEFKVDNPKAICFFFHGLHDHCGRYFEMARKFNEKQFSFFMVDMIGHGKSEGTRGSIPSIDVRFWF